MVFALLRAVFATLARHARRAGRALGRAGALLVLLSCVFTLVELALALGELVGVGVGQAVGGLLCGGLALSCDHARRTHRRLSRCATVVFALLHVSEPRLRLARLLPQDEPVLRAATTLVQPAAEPDPAGSATPPRPLAVATLETPTVLGVPVKHI